MSAKDTTIMVEYCYLKLHSWHERRGDVVVFMSRCDKYDTFTHELTERGQVREGAVMYLNGWEPPSGMLRGEPA